MRFKVLLIVALLLVVGVLPGAAQDDEFVFGLVLVGPRTDQGWSQAHYEGAQYVEENVPGARALVFDSLNPSDAPETTLRDVVQNMVDEGARLIITTSDAFEEDTNIVAEAFPDIVFVNVTGSNVLQGAPPNVGNYNAQPEWTQAINGCAAALTTETGNIGYLGPLINTETRRLAASSYLGARYCWENYAGMNPDDLTFTVTWIGFWFNIPGVTLNPTEEANSFFDNGADVVIGAIDTTEALVVAGQRREAGENVFATGYDYINACDQAPEVCIGVPYYNWGQYYSELVEQVRDGAWEQEWIWEEPTWDNIVDSTTASAAVSIGDALSEEDRVLLDEFIAEMTAFGSDPANDERIFLWEGPLTLQDGTVLAEEGEFVPLLDIWYLPQILDGMIGSSN
ncbi:MAG: BMP family ABC transporter substrate-binding protein [Pleurocapsa minor GSE-CHR-MK-17-07R]|nr:BMP family ABC transporter substrate-binding protein [Pleurocapsa minor GSE-CHR-MK 17-07R]